jgi:hypothetical protein
VRVVREIGSSTTPGSAAKASSRGVWSHMTATLSSSTSRSAIDGSNGAMGEAATFCSSGVKDARGELPMLSVKVARRETGGLVCPSLCISPHCGSQVQIPAAIASQLDVLGAATGAGVSTTAPISCISSCIA